MPTSNTTLSLCINGAAVRQRFSLRGYYQAAGSNTNMSIVQDCPVPQEISYQVSGVAGNEVSIIEKTYTAASGYFFIAPFSIAYTGDQMDESNYYCIETKTFDSSQRLTSINLKFYYTFPSENIFNDKIVVTVPATELAYVVSNKIRNYTFLEGNSVVGSSGCVKTVRFYGNPTATFTLATSNGSILDIGEISTDGLDTTVFYATTPTLTIPASGYFDIKIYIPAAGSATTYTFTLAGGNLVSPFPQPNPFYIYQKPNVVLTFSASGANMVVSTVAPSQTGFLKSFTANSEPASQTDDSAIIPYHFSVTGDTGQVLSIDDQTTETFGTWSNLIDVDDQLTSAITNTLILPVNDATNITSGMRVICPLITSDNIYTVASKSGNNVTVTGGPNLTLPNLANFSFSNRSGSELELPISVVLDEAATTATITGPGSIQRYGDTNKTFNLDLTSVLSIGSTNVCGKYTVSAGTRGGSFIYFDCITGEKRQIVLNKGDISFAICALASPAPSGSGTITVVNNNAVCAKTASTQLDCITWSIVYNRLDAKAKSVEVTYVDCVTLEEETINVGIGATATTQCGTRQVPISSDPGDGGAIITQAWDGSNPCT